MNFILYFSFFLSPQSYVHCLSLRALTVTEDQHMQVRNLTKTKFCFSSLTVERVPEVQPPQPEFRFTTDK